jgi:hypothetical protein
VTDIEALIDRLTDRQRHEFALACARRVQHLMTDPRSVAARAAAAAASAAASAAARSAAWAAEAAAWAAAAAEMAAAWDAARDAERAWQRAELERMLGEGSAA